MGLPTVLETHAYRGDQNPALLQAFEATRTLGLHITTISQRLLDDYAARGADPARLHVVPDGVDIELFARPDNPGPSPFDPGSPVALYAGHLYDHKGIPTIIDAAERCPSIAFHLVGGLGSDIRRTRQIVADRALDNVHIPGKVPHATVPSLLWHADALLLPPSAREPSKDWTSPVKLGEYLASGTPMVCTSIPALGDWIPRDLVEWSEPDNADALASATTRALALCDEAIADRACRALALAQGFSYPSRARSIVSIASEGRVMPARRSA